MSCLSKLKNVPGVSALDQKIGLIIPSVLQGRPLVQKIASVKQNLSAVTTEIGQQVSNQFNNAINAITGKIGATANSIKGIGASLQALPQKFVNGLQSVSTTIAKSAKAIGDAITCEATTLKDSITHAFETSELQTATQASVGAITVSNNVAKTLSEDPVAKQAAINAETERVKTETAAVAVATPSNNTVYTKQVDTVDKLETLPVVSTKNNFVYGIPDSRLKTYTRLERLNMLNRLVSDFDFGSYSKERQAAIKAEIKKLQASTELYPPLP